IDDRDAIFQPSLLEGKVIKREQTIRKIGVIVKVAVETSAAIFEIVEQRLSVPDGAKQEVRILRGNTAVVVTLEIKRGFGEGAKHQTIPICKNLFVATRLYAPLSYFVELG